jgi:putative Mg2+ transporter-C (MgtC) family protein
MEFVALRNVTYLAIVLRILLAVLCGGAIGLERGMKNRPAGLRTYMLVCVGACVVMLTNQYTYQVYQVGDPVRMGAQVISGIGFLGAGTIIVTSRNQIKGLTTAAGLWTAGGIGLAIGIGLYEVAIAASAAVFIILTVLHQLDFRVRKKAHILEAYVELDQQTHLGNFLKEARDRGLEPSNVQLDHEDVVSGSQLSFIVTIKGNKSQNQDAMFTQLRKLEGVEYIEIL